MGAAANGAKRPHFVSLPLAFWVEITHGDGRLQVEWACLRRTTGLAVAFAKKDLDAVVKRRDHL
jgi:hypothetical protein